MAILNVEMSIPAQMIFDVHLRRFRPCPVETCLHPRRNRKPEEIMKMGFVFFRLGGKKNEKVYARTGLDSEGHDR
jgi:hypothetical protein